MPKDIQYNPSLHCISSIGGGHSLYCHVSRSLAILYVISLSFLIRSFQLAISSFSGGITLEIDKDLVC